MFNFTLLSWYKVYCNNRFLSLHKRIITQYTRRNYQQSEGKDQEARRLTFPLFRITTCFAAALATSSCHFYTRYETYTLSFIDGKLNMHRLINEMLKLFCTLIENIFIQNTDILTFKLRTKCNLPFCFFFWRLSVWKTVLYVVLPFVPFIVYRYLLH